MSTPTPMMAQWNSCKEQAKEAILLFQMGEFYEAFYDDAVKISEVLDLTLTKRQEIPMAGIPLHTASGYIDKLVAKGLTVAIAEQTEDPKQAKGLVSREIVRVVSPGTAIGSSLILAGEHNFFAAITKTGKLFGLAALELSTAAFYARECDSLDELERELFKLSPSECLVDKRFHTSYTTFFSAFPSLIVTAAEPWTFGHELAVSTLTEKFGTHSLAGFGMEGKTAATNAAGALVHHLRNSLMQPLDHLVSVEVLGEEQFLQLDSATITNLELVKSLSSDPKSTLLHTLDETKTAMGARLLASWIKQPLKERRAIEERQEAVAELLADGARLRKIAEALVGIKDLERLLSKLFSPVASPRDLVALGSSLEKIPALKEALAHPNSPLLLRTEAFIEPLPDLTLYLSQAIVREPPQRVSDGDFIESGFSKELDELRAIRNDSSEWLAAYQQRLREETAIKTLKVGFSRQFGYFIEVSKGQTEKMPASFVRRQTLANAERYLSSELKVFEEKMLHAEERIARLEQELFNQILTRAKGYTPEITKIAKSVAVLDVLVSFAQVAERFGYTRPEVDESDHLLIEAGRHPVIERFGSHSFTPNDTELTNDKLMLITGPNMAGKSTYIRQNALIVVLAQIGSFVPAKRARIGIVDKLFTRIGASDDLSRGRSTFMVEMTETAAILNGVTDRSLVILDEIGRGTSTYDGISIAWAVAEYLLTAEGRRPKTLFATHYFELTKLEETLPGAVNYSVAVQEVGDTIHFLHKIVRGAADRSYGIHVAKLAGMPSWVVQRSQDILTHLEEQNGKKILFEPVKAKKAPKPKTHPTNQLVLF